LLHSIYPSESAYTVHNKAEKGSQLKSLLSVAMTLLMSTCMSMPTYDKYHISGLGYNTNFKLATLAKTSLIIVTSIQFYSNSISNVSNNIH